MTDEPNASGQATERPMTPEMEQAYRRLSKRAIVATSVVVIVVLAAAVLLATSAISARFEGARKLDRALTLTERADGVVLDIDEVVRSQVSAAIAQRAEELKKQLTPARNDLEESQALIAAAMDAVTEDEQEHANLLRASALARVAMLEPAATILDANVKAGLALAPSTDGWAALLSGEDLADQAVREYNKLKKSNAGRFNQLVAQSTASFRRAGQYFSEAASAFPEAGANRYKDFADDEIAALALLKQSGAAALKGDVEGSNGLLKRYEAKEAVIQDLAASLPPTPSKAVADAYQKLAGEATKRYEAARKLATEADARLDAF